MAKRTTKAARTPRPRKSKAERQAEEAQRLAALLASAPAEGPHPLAPPAFIVDPRLAAAAQVWRDLAPILAEREQLGEHDRGLFAMLCYYQAEWIAAVDDILERGYSFMAKAIAGGRRPWINPSVARRDAAFGHVLDLSARFGLTPLDRHKLHRAEKDSGLMGGLFPTQQQPLPVAGEGDQPAAPADASGGWNALLDRTQH